MPYADTEAKRAYNKAYRESHKKELKEKRNQNREHRNAVKRDRYRRLAAERAEARHIEEQRQESLALRKGALRRKNAECHLAVELLRTLLERGRNKRYQGGYIGSAQWHIHCANLKTVIRWYRSQRIVTQQKAYSNTPVTSGERRFAKAMKFKTT